LEERREKRDASTSSATGEEKRDASTSSAAGEGQN